MQVRHYAAQRLKFEVLIGSLTKKMSRRNLVDLKKVEKKLGLVPCKNKENNSPTTLELLLISTVLVCTEIK